MYYLTVHRHRFVRHHFRNIGPEHLHVGLLAQALAKRLVRHQQLERFVPLVVSGGQKS